MKKLLFLLITLITFTNVSYASFPITGNYTETLEILSLEEDDDEDEPPWLGILFGALILGFASYFLIRAWWRAWRDRVKWVRILTFIVLGFLTLIGLLSILCSIGDGCIYNMQ